MNSEHLFRIIKIKEKIAPYVFAKLSCLWFNWISNPLSENQAYEESSPYFQGESGLRLACQNDSVISSSL